MRLREKESSVISRQSSASGQIPESRTAPLRRLWRYATAHRRRIARATTWSILNKTFDIAPPILIGAAVDIVVRQEDSVLASFGIEEPRTQVVVLAVLTFVIWALESVFEYLLRIEWRNLAQSIQHDLRIDAYSHMQHLELQYFEDRSTGDLMAVLNDDVNQLERFLDNGANEILQVLTTVSLIGAIFFYLAPGIAWLAFLPVPVILWGSFVFQRKLEPRYADVREQAAMVNSELSNNLGGIATIKSFTAEEHEVERISAESEAYRQANRRAIVLSSAFSPLIRIVILVGFTATLMLAHSGHSTAAWQSAPTASWSSLPSDSYGRSPVSARPSTYIKERWHRPTGFSTCWTPQPLSKMETRNSSRSTEASDSMASSSATATGFR